MIWLRLCDPARHQGSTMLATCALQVAKKAPLQGRSLESGAFQFHISIPGNVQLRQPHRTPGLI